jgi:purine catabolism regulator
LQVHQVGSNRDVAGYLVIGSRLTATSRNRDLSAQGAALFDLLLRAPDPNVTDRLGREALLDILETGGSAAVDLLARWGVRETRLTGFLLGVKTRTIDLEHVAVRWLDELGFEHILCARSGRVRGFVPDELAEGLAALVTSADFDGGAVVRLGLGLPAATDSLHRSAVQALQALDSAFEDGRKVVRYRDLPTVRTVLGGLSDDATRRLAEVLDGLRDADGAHRELTQTLRVFLGEHGGHRASAARLGIHRQTLLARVRRVEMLTGLSMDRPDDRATTWLALRALGM